MPCQTRRGYRILGRAGDDGAPPSRHGEFGQSSPKALGAAAGDLVRGAYRCAVLVTGRMKAAFDAPPKEGKPRKPMVLSPRRHLDALASKLGYFRVMSIYAAERFTYLVVNFFVFPIVARAYGPEVLGRYSLAQTIVSLVTPFLAAGAEAIVIRDLVRRRRERGPVAGSAALLLGLFTVPAVSAPIIYASVIFPDDPIMRELVWCLAIAFVPAPVYVIDFLWKSEMRPAFSVLPRLLIMPLALAAKAAAARAGLSIIAIGAITAAEAWISACLVAIVYLVAKRPGERWGLDRTALRALFRQTFPAMVSWLAGLIFFRITHLMLGYLTDYREVGIYSVAFQLIQIPNILPTIVLSTCYPRLVALKEEHPARYTEYLDKLLSFFSLAGWSLVAAVLLFGDWGTTRLFGAGFAGSGPVLLLLSAATLCNFSGAVRGQVIFIANRPNLHVVNALVGLAVMVPADLLLIPLYGALGGAAAVAIASFAASLLTSFLFAETSAVGRLQFRRLFLPSFKFWKLPA
jgi:O-antigen/teichoic acid export membrane protein